MLLTGFLINVEADRKINSDNLVDRIYPDEMPPRSAVGDQICVLRCGS